MHDFNIVINFEAHLIVMLEYIYQSTNSQAWMTIQNCCNSSKGIGSPPGLADRGGQGGKVPPIFTRQQNFVCMTGFEISLKILIFKGLSFAQNEILVLDLWTMFRP